MLEMNEAAMVATVKSLRTDAVLPGAEDVEAMSNRCTVMELLFLLTRRDNPAHMLRGTYTGLAGPMPAPPAEDQIKSQSTESAG